MNIRFLFFLLIIWACENEFEIELPDYEPKLVVDGWVEQGTLPHVLLTLSAPYFDRVDSATYLDLLVNSANVSITAPGQEPEFMVLQRTENIFPYFVYKGFTRAQSGKSYQLTINFRGIDYLATTSIPEPIPIDSVWFEVLEGDSSGLINISFTDDADQKDFYRVFTKVLGKEERFIPVYLSAFSDAFFNGEQFSFALLKGPEDYTSVNNDIYFKKGDTVLVKLCTIDEDHFRFWRSAEKEIYQAGNPLASSGINPEGNISGGALGYWGGYGATVDTVILR